MINNSHALLSLKGAMDNTYDSSIGHQITGASDASTETDGKGWKNNADIGDDSDNRISDEAGDILTRSKPLGEKNNNVSTKKHQEGGKGKQNSRQPNQFQPINSPEEVGDKLDRSQMENLFVDMAFFARLGFKQPASCLSCAYRAAKAGNENADSMFSGRKCSRLVLWRKDASLPIHPDRMKSNSVVVTCDTAKAWMQGETVASWKWDKESCKLQCTT